MPDDSGPGNAIDGTSIGDDFAGINADIESGGFDSFYGGWEEASMPDDNADAFGETRGGSNSTIDALINAVMPFPINAMNLVASQFGKGFGDLAQGDPDPAFGTGVDGPEGGPGVGGGPSDDFSREAPGGQPRMDDVVAFMGSGGSFANAIEDATPAGGSGVKGGSGITPAHTNLYNAFTKADADKKKMKQLQGTMVPMESIVKGFSI
jgi:hypothetical protein